MVLEVIYQDEWIVAVNKPHGLLVHRTGRAKDATVFALQTLRNQLGRHVYPVHRLDRKTGGVLLFALDEDIHRVMQKAFAEKKISKKYLAIVRGFTDDTGIIDYPIRKENGIMQDAVTRYKTLDRVELDFPSGHNKTSRYSLVEIYPETGRQHQIRKHFKHLHHPIIADRPYGCNKQNKLFKEKFSLTTMMLHASKLKFVHPVSERDIVITAKIQSEFQRMIEILGFRCPH